MRKLKVLPMTSALVLAMTLPAVADQHEDAHERVSAPEEANVYFVRPGDGETVSTEFKVIFGLEGMGVCPAGITASGQPIPNTGHHHLLVDVEELPPMDQPLPADQPERIRHFGGGQTETTIELPPGKHTLQLIFADYAHVPHDPVVKSKKITVHVKE